MCIGLAAEYARRYDYWTLVSESGVVTQHISCICVFVAFFAHTETGVLSAGMLLAITAVLGV